jgi:putative methionine-R-sulfoxide reductase with GAF domain
MTNRTLGFLRSETLKYMLLGVSIGILFPVLATLFEMSIQKLPAEMASALFVQRSNPLLWIIDSAPLMLGLFAAIAGYRQESLLQLNAELNTRKAEAEISQKNVEQLIIERTGEVEKLYKQMSRRAAQLKAVTELSESIAQLQNLNEIFPTATRLISERFGFYHVGVFIMDQDRQYAVLQAANSEGGAIMLKRNHRLQLGVGVVGFCAQSGQPRIALDVGADAVYFNNPDLPTTRSEAALPIKARGVTIGVLDVQSTEADAFSPEDLEVLTTLANQVSIALENARLLTEARAAYTQMQEVYNEFTRRNGAGRSRRCNRQASAIRWGALKCSRTLCKVPRS